MDLPTQDCTLRQLKKQIKENLEPKKDKLKIVTIRENPRGVKIVTGDSDMERKIKGHKGLEGLTVKTQVAKKINPRILIYDVPSELSL